MRMLKISIIVVLLTGFISTIGFSQDKLRKEGRHYVADITKEFKVNKSGDLHMEEITGDVNIATWNKNQVWIHEIRKMDVYTKTEAEAFLKDTKQFYSQSGNKIKVGGSKSARSYMDSSFEIKLPHEFNVDISTKGGDISINELKGSADLNTSGGDIDLNSVEGEVKAKTSGGDIKVVKNTNMVSVKTSGGDIDIIDVLGEVNAKTSGGDILIKNNKAKIDAKTSGGDIEMENVGDEVEAITSGGDIEVEGSAGDIEVKTSGGDIELINIKGAARGKTSGGDIEATTIEEGISVKTSGGDIDLKDIQGFIEAATSGGDVEAEMSEKAMSKDHHVDLKSSGGNLTLWIPSGLKATISAEIKLTGSSWGKSNDRYNIFSDFDLTTEMPDEETRERYIRAQGKINGGGDLINLNTVNGNIRINKLK